MTTAKRAVARAAPRRAAAARSAPTPAKASILGDHPQPPHPFGEVWLAKDGKTQSKVPHRALCEADGKRSAAVESVPEDAGAASRESRGVEEDREAARGDQASRPLRSSREGCADSPPIQRRRRETSRRSCLPNTRLPRTNASASRYTGFGTTRTSINR